MTTFCVTPSALAHIRNVIEAEEMAHPVVCIAWMTSQADLVRDDQGQAVWTHSEPEWVAAVLELEDISAWPGNAVELHGLKFSLRGKAESPGMQGCMLTCESDRLAVHEEIR